MHTPFSVALSQRVKDSATMAGLAPCERMFHAQVCAPQRTHFSNLAARPKTAPRRQGLQGQAALSSMNRVRV